VSSHCPRAEACVIAHGCRECGADVGEPCRPHRGAIEALAVAKELAERHLLAYEHADAVVEQIDAALELLGGRTE
jgi:hypothetical protein